MNDKQQYTVLSSPRVLFRCDGFQLSININLNRNTYIILLIHFFLRLHIWFFIGDSNAMCLLNWKMKIFPWSWSGIKINHYGIGCYSTVLQWEYHRVDLLYSFCVWIQTYSYFPIIYSHIAILAILAIIYDIISKYAKRVPWWCHHRQFVF